MRTGHCWVCHYSNESETAICSRMGCPMMHNPRVTPIGEAAGKVPDVKQPAPVAPVESADTDPIA